MQEKPLYTLPLQEIFEYVSTLRDEVAFRTTLDALLASKKYHINKAIPETGMTLLAFLCANAKVKVDLDIIRIAIEEYNACPEFIGADDKTALAHLSEDIRPALSWHPETLIESYRKKNAEDFKARRLLATQGNTTNSIEGLKNAWDSFIETYSSEKYTVSGFTGEETYSLANSPISEAFSGILLNLRNHLFLSQDGYDGLVMQITGFKQSLKDFYTYRNTKKMLFNSNNAEFLEKYNAIIAIFQVVLDKHVQLGALETGKKAALLALEPQLQAERAKVAELEAKVRRLELGQPNIAQKEDKSETSDQEEEEWEKVAVGQEREGSTALSWGASAWKAAKTATTANFFKSAAVEKKEMVDEQNLFAPLLSDTRLQEIADPTSSSYLYLSGDQNGAYVRVPKTVYDFAHAVCITHPTTRQANLLFISTRIEQKLETETRPLYVAWLQEALRAIQIAYGLNTSAHANPDSVLAAAAQ